MIISGTIVDFFYIDSSLDLSPKKVRSSDVIVFSDSLFYTYKHHFLLDHLNLSQDIRVSPKRLSILHNLSFYELRSLGHIYHETLLQYLSFHDQIKKVIPASIYQNLFLYDSFRIPIISNLQLVQVVDYEISRHISSKITFNSIVHVNKVKKLTRSDHLDLNSFIGWYLSNQVCSSSPSPILSSFIILRNSNLSLILDLRNPEFGDLDGLESKRIQRNLRNLDVQVYQDGDGSSTKWNNSDTETVSYHIIEVKEDVITNYKSFVRQIYGNLIQLVDYEGITRNGILIPKEIKQVGRYIYDLSFDFQIVV